MPLSCCLRFTRQLEQAYRTRGGSSLNFEARLVHELWHAACRSGEALDPEAAHQLRLARLAQAVAVPSYALGLTELSDSEQQFLKEAGARVTVRCFDFESGAGDAISQALAAAWPRDAGYADLRTRASDLELAHPESPLAGRMRIFAAASAEVGLT